MLARAQMEALETGQNVPLTIRQEPVVITPGGSMKRSRTTMSKEVYIYKIILFNN